MTQSPVDFIEFSDKPLRTIPAAELFHQHFPAKYFTQYLEDYIEEHIYAEKTLRSRICFGARVKHVSKVDDVWTVQTFDGRSFRARKLVDAVGLTSQPIVPNISGKEIFQGIQLHHKDFGQSNLLVNPDVRSIAVIGGSKSAADVAYAAAKAGKTVHWLIRKSGTGPSWFVPVYGLGYKAPSSTHALWIRLMTPMLASIFAEPSNVSRFLYRSWLGQFIFWRFWALVALAVSSMTKYDRKGGRKNGFYNLKPDTAPFWANDSTSLINRADFLDTIANHVQVYREDVESIHERSTKLSNGTKLEADAIVYGTGWRSDIPYFDKPLALWLGLPVPEEDHDAKHQQRWEALDQEAAAKVDVEMPVLSSKDPYWKHDSHRTPLRLYKCMLPISDQSIVFLGKTVIGHVFPSAEVEALWAVAALDGRIALPTVPDMEREVARVVAWSRKRYPSRGRQAMWIPWDLIPFTDMLLKQLGLVSHRGETWWKDLTTPTSSQRLKGLIAEYKRKYS